MMEIKEFKSDYIGNFKKIDPNNPYWQLNIGLFHLPLNVQGCSAFVYLPPHTTCSCWSIALLLPDDMSVDEFFSKTAWNRVADKEKLVLFLLKPNTKWEFCDSPTACVEGLRDKLEIRDHYVTQVFFAYLVGYDQGASVALSYTANHPASYAGFGYVGKFECHKDYLRSSNSNLLPYIKCDEVPVPAYFRVREKSESLKCAFEHFQVRNNATAQIFHDGSRYVSYSTQNEARDTINGQFVADVIADICPDEELYSPEATVEIWKQVHRTIRTTGVGPGGLHKFRTLEEIGITTHELIIDGFKRHWCEYIPKRNVSRKAKRPVVVFCHGGTQVAESGLYAAEWFNVAESRDFIVLFPSGGMAQTRLNANPMPTWNIDCKQDNYMDDEQFIREMIRDLSEREEIDYSRIYITGHSMGSGMTQRCLLDMPDIFAAGASNSGVTLGEFNLPTTKTDYNVACLIAIGEHDVDNFDLNNSERVRRNLEYWIDRNNLEPFEEGGSYNSGRYYNTVWCNKKGVPMLRYIAVLDKTHSVMPQDAWTYYDDYLCKFSRDENGNLLYLGKPVN